jgi:hypothetical protein
LLKIKERNIKYVCFAKKRGLEETDMCSSEYVYKQLRRFRAGIESGISWLKRSFGLTRCTWEGVARTMTYRLIIEKKSDVLWVTASGRRSPETVLGMSKDILAACVEQGVKKVLADVRGLEGRLPRLEAYDIPDKHFPKMRDRAVLTHTAVVDMEEFKNSYRFFENVSANRGFNLRIFSDPDQALDWLKK